MLQCLDTEFLKSPWWRHTRHTRWLSGNRQQVTISLSKVLLRDIREKKQALKEKNEKLNRSVKIILSKILSCIFRTTLNAGDFVKNLQNLANGGIFNCGNDSENCTCWTCIFVITLIHIFWVDFTTKVKIFITFQFPASKQVMSSDKDLNLRFCK